MDNLSALYESSHANGMNNEDYNNATFFGAAPQRQNAIVDPNWAISSGHVPSRGQSHSANPAWQHHQFQQHVQHQHQQYQNPHTLYQQNADIYATPYNRNNLNFNESGLNTQSIDTSFPFDPALGSAESGPDSNLNTIQPPYHSLHNATISPHALQVNQDAVAPVSNDTKEQQVFIIDSQFCI